MAKQGLLIVLSAPSGAGKATLLQRMRQRGAVLNHPVSVTTRQPRADEAEGREYYFKTEAEFDALLEQGAFVEWAAVHGARYGTLRSELERYMTAGSDVVLELDVQGMRNLRQMGLPVVAVFLLPPDLHELERRIRGRGQNDEASINLRMQNARDEIAAKNEYDHVIVNDDLDEAARLFERVLEIERARR